MFITLILLLTGKNRIDELFLRYDANRSGFIDKENLRDMCKAISLPLDDDVMNAVSKFTDVPYM